MIFEIVAILCARKWPFLSYFPSKINLGPIIGDILNGKWLLFNAINGNELYGNMDKF